jgi:hypothetical protein
MALVFDVLIILMAAKVLNGSAVGLLIGLGFCLLINFLIKD